jgi:hypothetical protein
MEHRIEEFIKNGRSFIYYDLSGFKTNIEFLQFIELAKNGIRKYPEHSLYTITNIKGVKFDSDTKEIVAAWTKFNKPYVKYGVVLGMDGIRKIMVNAVFAMSGRQNMSSASTREQAVEWLLKQD